MPHDLTFYAVAIPAVILLGLAKGGLAGVGNIAVPMLTLVISPVQAAALILPILIVQDVVGVWAFRKTWDGKILALMLPSAAAGVFLGYVLAARVSADAVECSLGIISVVFGVRQLWVDFRQPLSHPKHAPAWQGALYGVASGFTSQIAHSGGPPFQMYVMPKKLPRDVFVGTTALFFATVNWIKVPAYLALGQMTRATLMSSAALLPLAVASTWAGVWLVRRISGQKFYRIAYALLVLVGLRLAWNGGMHWLGGFD